jgi:hypothetical protein
LRDLFLTTSRLTEFFNKFLEIAGPNSVLSPAAAALQAPVLHIGQLDPGVISGDVYSNQALGFSYQFPHGWSITDKATQQKAVERRHQDARGDTLLHAD